MAVRPRSNRRTFLAATTAAAGYFCGAPSIAADTARIASDEDGDVFQVAVKLTTPKSGKDKRVPLPLDSVSCSVFIPRGAKQLRGATLNPFYEPTVNQEHWRAAAGLWGFAHVGLNFFGVKQDELGETTARALAALGEASGHPELADAPLCIQGMSIGGGLTSRLVEAMPSRVIAAAPVCLEVGPRDKPSGGVPMLTVFGERDGRQMEILSEKLPLARTDHAQWAIAPQWGRKHEWHMANNIILSFYQRVIDFRLPAMKSYKESDGWLGDCATWKAPSPVVTPFAEYEGDRTQACWLPDAYTAALWRSFVGHDSPLSIAAPHGVSSGHPFVQFAAGKPIDVKVKLNADADVEINELFAGDRKLCDIDKTLVAQVELPAGAHALIAVGTRTDGSKCYSPPNTVVVQ